MECFRGLSNLKHGKKRFFKPKIECHWQTQVDGVGNDPCAVLVDGVFETLERENRLAESRNISTAKPSMVAYMPALSGS